MVTAGGSNETRRESYRCRGTLGSRIQSRFPKANRTFLMQASHQILQEARRLGVDALYSEKGHFMAARLCKSIGYFIAIPSTISAAAAGAAFFKGKHGELAGWLAVASSALTALGAAL